MRMRFSISMFLLTFLATSVFGQTYWQKVDESEIENYRIGERHIFPTEYGSFTLDVELMKEEFSKCPQQKIGGVRNKSKIISIPFPSGELVEFDMRESSVMAPKLAEKYSSIKSYKGVSTNGKYITRISFSNAGLHAAINTVKGTIYIDPVFPDLKNPSLYQSYYIRNQIVPEGLDRGCGTVSQPVDNFDGLDQSIDLTERSATVDLRKFRFALACTGEYAQIVGGTVTDVMEQFNIALNRINQVYELDCSMTFELIENNDELIFLDGATDPYNEPDIGGGLLQQNINALNQRIGVNNFDIGHIFTRRCSDGLAGVAFGGSACTNNKGAGVSCVGGSNISSFAAGTMAHEVGHQFSAGLSKK